MFKTCCTCLKELSVENFHKNRSTSDGLHWNCKKCKSEQAKKTREKHKDKIRQRDREYWQKNKDEINERRRENYPENRDVIIQRVCEYAKNNRDKCNALAKNMRDRLKDEVISHYCDGEIQCKSCNEQDIDILSIDHINGNGAEHRREIGLGRKCGYHFYRWLNRNNFPEGFQVLCFNCQFRKRALEMKPDNPTHLQEVRARYARKIKLECLDSYGGHSCPCGETDIEVLTLDHVNDDGSEHRRETGTKGNNFYHMLRKNEFPNDPPLQVLCMNCQFKKRAER